MKTLEEVINTYKSNTLDARDLNRLLDFMDFEHATKLAVKLGGWNNEEEARKHFSRDPWPWTEERVKKQLAEDVAFGFEKALHKRGLSAGTMGQVVEMWMWILEDSELQGKLNQMYAYYGLPYFKAVALKYDLPNPIGEDSGSEEKYNEYGE